MKEGSWTVFAAMNSGGRCSTPKPTRISTGTSGVGVSLFQLYLLNQGLGFFFNLALSSASSR